MLTNKIRQEIQKAFGMKTNQLKKVFKKTDFRKAYDLKFLLLLLWNYGTINHGNIKFDRDVIKKAIALLPEKEVKFFARVAK